MKKQLLSLAIILLSACGAMAQNVYWVFLTDKAGTTFDPYEYFDARAIERYAQCGADLYDISNYPLNATYAADVDALATETVGQSRWFNAIGVVATAEQVSQIEALPFVDRVQIVGDMIPTAASEASDIEVDLSEEEQDSELTDQLVRMQGQLFRAKGIDGRGVRIAVFDGGFPRVNTHAAFKHLRDEGRIVKTWNFPNRKENVYGWNSHGTMTLSCIGGRIAGHDLGLATGAEFMLARTEVNSEPFKEEVWWQMAVEWADAGGANIISSSLGYGKERHYTTDMDGTSYVARAGNMAARKGILVVNSAGNEATDKQWITIITPSDADSVLCVGGIEHSLSWYDHISFSSLGPSADGRIKPNVCAFGHALTADVANDSATHYVDGTSFSCPLVAGFAACAWQASKGKTAMQMFHEIEHSADLYPYYDYAFGYGVPQASYFTEDRKPATPTYRVEIGKDSTALVATTDMGSTYLFFHFRDPETKRLSYYGHYYIDTLASQSKLKVSNAAIFNRTLMVNLNGYTTTITLPEEKYMEYVGLSDWEYAFDRDGEGSLRMWSGRWGTTVPSKWGSNAPWSFDVAFMFGLPVATSQTELTPNNWSPSWRGEGRITRALCKAYRLGIGIELGRANYRWNGQSANPLEQAIGFDDAAIAAYDKKVSTRRTELYEVGLEFFQRVRLVPLGLFGRGLHWDLGIYGTYGWNTYRFKGSQSNDVATSRKTVLRSINPLEDYRWNYGISTRLTYDVFGIYARYRLNGIGSTPALGYELPRLEVGIQVML